MKRKLDGGYELDDDPTRVDVDAVHDYLCNHSYWAAGRPRDVVERLIRETRLVIGHYHDGRLVGFARAFTDGATIAYLADVYVLPEHRGRGLGVALVRELVENGPHPNLKWILHTRDAHELYRKLGFDDPSDLVMERRPA
jgi:GNAT superfamily N-acetyltransferase